jgi:hypothetical protein
VARIFLSHSSSDNDLARALRDWLVAEGWDDLFLDFDPQRGIAAGEKWEKALLDAAGRCEAVLFVVTRNWLGSGWCLKEFHLAEKLNKRMFMLLADGLGVPDLPPELTAEWQLVDLTPGAEFTAFPVTDGISAAAREVRFSSIGLQRLRSGLNRAGLDPRFFAWPPASDPERPPYRGLRALEADDAGIFFGREAQTIAAMDRLRGLREGGAPRFLAILGASGAGKSSFLRAGLLPRLQRDDRHYCALPVIRPERAVLTGESGFVRSIIAALQAVGHSASRSQIEGVVDAGAEAVARLFRILAQVTTVPAAPGEPPPKPPSIVVSIDQGEELFLAEGAEETAAFLKLLADLSISEEINLIVLVAIRSDSYEQLQTAPQLEGLRHETLSLPPMPRGAYASVINGPAERLSQSGRKLVVEPALTQALLADIEDGGAKDALPLLAFTLELLYLNHGGKGRLTLDDYAALGGIKGSIEVAVEKAMAAADSDPRVPQDRDQRLALMRRAFIPWLAGVDRASNSVRRRVAKMAEVPVEARPLVECLIGARLLSTDITLDREVTVEPAHEALLRQWGMLQGWLEEDFAAMAALEGVQRAARDWEANLRDPGWLAHSAGRLEDAEASHAQENLSTFLTPSEVEYLKTCRITEDERRNRELEEARKLAASRAQTVRRTRIGLAAALVLAAAAGVAGWYATLQRDEAERQRVTAVEQQRKAQASLAVVNSGQAARDNRTAIAAGYAFAGYSTLANRETRSALLEAGRGIDPHLAAVLPQDANASVTALAWVGSSELIAATKTGARTGLQRMVLSPDGPARTMVEAQIPKVMHDPEDEAGIIALASVGDGVIAAARNTGMVEFYSAGDVGAESGKPAFLWSWAPPKPAEPYSFSKAAISANASHIVFGGANGALFVRCRGPSLRNSDVICTASTLLSGSVTAVAVDAEAKESHAAMEGGIVLRNGGDGAPEPLQFTETGTNITALAIAGGRLSAFLRGVDAGSPTALALLERQRDDLVVTARAPVNIGPGQALIWRNDMQLLHNCLDAGLRPGPLCASMVMPGNAGTGIAFPLRLFGHEAPADLIAVAADGSKAASRALGKILIWQWPADRSIHNVAAQVPAGGWASMTPGPANRAILLSGKDGAGLALEPGKDAAEQTALPVLEGEVIAAVGVEGGRVVARGTTLHFVRDGASDSDKTVELPAPVLAQGGLIWTGRGSRVAISLDDFHIALVDFSDETPSLLEFKSPPGTFQPFGITMDRSRNRLIVSTRDGLVHAFNIETRDYLARIGNNDGADVSGLLGAEGLAVSDDGRWLVTTAAGNRFVLYNLESGTRTIVNAGLGDSGAATYETKSVAFAPAGDRLAVIDAASNLSLWSLAGSVPERFLDLRLPPSQANFPTALSTVTFASDGSLMVLTGSSEVVQVRLDEAAWLARIRSLGYDKAAPPM